MPQSEFSALHWSILRALNAAPIGAHLTCETLGDGNEDWTHRNVRRAARDLNAAGFPIVSSTRGFRLARQPEDIRAYRGALLQRARAILDRIGVLDTIESQMEASGERGRRAREEVSV